MDVPGPFPPMSRTGQKCILVAIVDNIAES